MIKFRFKVKGKTIEANCPENWSEVTLRQLVNMESWTGEQSDMLGLLSAFTDQRYEDLENSTSNIWEPLFTVLSFVFEAPDWRKLARPKSVSLGSKQIRPNKKVNLSMFGQKVLALNVIASEKPEVQKIPEILAIFLQPSYDGVFVTERVEELKEDVLNMKAFEAMPYGIFFLKRLLKQKSYGKIGLRPYPRIMKTLLYMRKLALKSLNPSTI